MDISKETIIPSDYIWPENEQPGITTVHDPGFRVPVIDLENQDEERLVKLIAEASSEIGLFQVINHGIPSDLVEKLQRVGKEFFELPQHEKEKYSKLPGSVEGYGTTLQKEDEAKQGLKKGWSSHIFHKIWPPSAVDLTFWPKTPSSYR